MKTKPIQCWIKYKFKTNTIVRFRCIYLDFVTPSLFYFFFWPFPSSLSPSLRKWNDFNTFECNTHEQDIIQRCYMVYRVWLLVVLATVADYTYYSLIVFIWPFSFIFNLWWAYFWNRIYINRRWASIDVLHFLEQE